MKKLIFLTLITLSFIYSNAQVVSNGGSFNIDVYSEGLTGIVSSQQGDLTYIIDTSAGNIIVKNILNEVVSTSLIPHNMLTRGPWKLTQTEVDTDLNFEFIAIVTDDSWQDRILTIFDDDGTILLEIEDIGDWYLVHDISNYLIVYKNTVDFGVLGTKWVVELNGSLPNTVYDTLTIVSYDSITSFIYDTVTIENYDTITYLNTSYFAEYENLTLGLNGSLEKSTSLNPDVCIYPNPATTSINIECDTKFDGYTLSMVEVATGRVIFVEVISQTQTILSIKDLGVVPGMYQLVFENGENLISKKLIVN